MKLSKLLVASAIALSFTATTALADYNKGFKYYQKFIKNKTKIKGSEFIKIIGVKSNEELEELFKDNAKGLIEKLEKSGHKDAAKAVKKIVKKHKLKDLKDFLKGLLNGKIPAGC